MAVSENLKWACDGLTFINGNPLFKVKLLHKKHTSIYKIVVEGPFREEHEAKGWEAADKKYQEITKKYNHQSIKTT